MKIYSLYILIILIFCRVAPAYAETFTLIGDETWNSPPQPSGVGEPEDDDNVIIPNGTSLTIDGDSMEDPFDANSTPNIGTITGTGDGSLTISPSNTSQTIDIRSISLADGSITILVGSDSLILQIAEGVTISGGVGAFDIVGGGVVEDDVIDIDGDFSNSGDTNILGGTNSNDTYLKLGGSTISSSLFTLDDTNSGERTYLVFDGATNQTVSGTIDANAGSVFNGTISITNSSGTVTFEDLIGDSLPIREINIGSGAHAIFENFFNTQDIEVNGTITLTGVDVNSGEMGNTTGSTITFSNGSKIIIDNSTVSGDSIFVLGGGETLSAENVTVQLPTTFTSGSIILIDGVNLIDDFVETNPGVTSEFNTINNGLTTYTVSYSSEDIDCEMISVGCEDIIITASQQTAEESVQSLNLSSQGVNSKTETAFTTAWTFLSDDTGLDSEAYNAFNTVISAGGAASAILAKQTVPQMDAVAGANSIISSVSNSSMNIASSRLASVRGNTLLAEYNNGQVLNDAGFDLFNFKDKQVFLKTFGTQLKGDSYDNISGFKTDVHGFIFGADEEQADGSRLGFAYSFSDSDVSGKGSGQSVTKVDTHQLMLYGDKNFGEFLFEGMTGFSDNSNTTSRKINQGGINRIAIGKFNSRSLFARGSLSKDISNPIGDGVAQFTFGASASNTNNSSYTETGANSLNMNVNPDDTETLVGFTSLKFNKNLDAQSLETKMLEFRVGTSYDFIGDQSTSISSYTGGGNSFSVDGNPADQFGVNLGLGYLFFEDETKKYSFNYDTEFKDHSISKSLSFDLIYQF